MRFARWVFTAAGVSGLIVMLPQLFLEARIGRDTPPPITHPEYFYGFVWVTVAWQIAFLVIGRNPSRFRALMPVAVVEKFPFAITAFVLFAQARVGATILPFAAIDTLLGSLFVISYLRTPAIARADPAA